MIYDQFDLLEFLNYDSNTKSFLSIEERMMLHREISRKMNGEEIRRLPAKLEHKLIEIKQQMKKTKWEPAEIRYGQDRLPFLTKK